MTELKAPIPNSYIVTGTRLIAGEYPGAPNAKDAERKLAALLDAGISSFVDLTAPEDGLDLYEDALRASEKGRALERLHAPIPDVSITDDVRMRRILDYIDSALDTGQTVYVHCWGGVGRTGTVIGCWLVRRGRSADDALAEVDRMFATMSESKRRGHPRGSPETSTQREMVRRWRAVEDQLQQRKPIR